MGDAYYSCNLLIFSITLGKVAMIDEPKVMEKI